MAPTAGSVIRTSGLRCELDNGVVLIADAWHPSEGGPFPALLQRLPYGRSVASTPALPHPAWLAAQGYLVVVQDVRGRGDSSGTFEPFVHASSDGAQSIEWVASLPECNGDVATYGFSYQGLLQLYAAAERPPSLRAIAPMMCASDPYEGWTYEGGCLRWPFVCFWAAQLAGQTSGEGPVPFNLDALPITDALGADPPSWFIDWLEHRDAEDDFWVARRPNLDAINVPAFVVAGWFDDFSSASLRLAERLEAELHVGPWAHMPWGTRLGDVELGPDASPAATHAALVAFFDRHLKDDVAGPEPTHVRYYTHGRGWETAAQWPPTTRPTVMHGASGGNANSRHGDGVLLPSTATHSLGDIALLGDIVVAELLNPYPGVHTPLSDEGPSQDRRDVCCYTSDPFPEPMTLTGTIKANVLSRSDRSSHDVVASLVLIDPDSAIPRRLATGVQRLHSTRAGDEQVAEIHLRPISWVIPAGGLLRLDISGARFPAFDRNPHTNDGVAVLARASQTSVATLEILSVELTLPFT